MSKSYQTNTITTKIFRPDFNTSYFLNKQTSLKGTLKNLSLDLKITNKQQKLESGLSFELITSFNPSGDQPKAITELV